MKQQFENEEIPSKLAHVALGDLLPPLLLGLLLSFVVFYIIIESKFVLKKHPINMQNANRVGLRALSADLSLGKITLARAPPGRVTMLRTRQHCHSNSKNASNYIVL